MFFPPLKKVNQIGDPNLYYVPYSEPKPERELSAHEKVTNAMAFNTTRRVKHGIIVMATAVAIPFKEVEEKYARLKLSKEGRLFLCVYYPTAHSQSIKKTPYSIEVNPDGSVYQYAPNSCKRSLISWRFLTPEEDAAIRDPTKRPHRYIHDIP